MEGGCLLMINRIIFISLFLSFLFSARIEYPLFTFDHPGKDVTYSIYKINADNSDGKPIVNDEKLKKKLFSNVYKIEFDFQDNDYRIKFNFIC